MKDFIERMMLNAYAQQPPKFLQQMEERFPGTAKMPRLWQVMVAPALILIYAGLIVTGSWGVLLGLTILLLIGLILILLTHPMPDDRGGWDDVYLP